MVLSILASVGCGLAPSLGVLIVARFVQGAAAAAMMPASMALIRQAFPGAKARGRAVGVWAMGGAVASSSGPVIGGALNLLDWRLIFFINVPVGAIALLLLARTRASRPRVVPFDLAGQVTGVLAMAGLTFGAIEAAAHGFSDPAVIAAFAGAAAGLARFVRAQQVVAHPMMPLQLFRSRTVAITVAVGFTFMVGYYYGLPFVISLFLQQHRGLDALQTGVVFLPMILIELVLTPFSARMSERLGRKTVILAGLLLMTTGLAVIGLQPASTPLWLLAGLMVLVGLCGPAVSPPATAVLLDAVGHDQAGVASGVFNTSRQVGGALAIAVFGRLLARPRHVRARRADQPAHRRRRARPDHRARPVPAHHEGALMTDNTAHDPADGGEWTAGDLDRFGAAGEIEISTRREDGSLRGFVPIWIVAVDDALYVRSYRGRDGAWYRHAAARPAGAIRAAGQQADVSFTRIDAHQPDLLEAIGDAYRAKYARYGQAYLRPMLADQAVAATMRIDPQI